MSLGGGADEIRIGVEDGETSDAAAAESDAESAAERHPARDTSAHERKEKPKSEENRRSSLTSARAASANDTAAAAAAAAALELSSLSSVGSSLTRATFSSALPSELLRIVALGVDGFDLVSLARVNRQCACVCADPTGVIWRFHALNGGGKSFRLPQRNHLPKSNEAELDHQRRLLARLDPSDESRKWFIARHQLILLSIAHARQRMEEHETIRNRAERDWVCHSVHGVLEVPFLAALLLIFFIQLAVTLDRTEKAALETMWPLLVVAGFIVVSSVVFLLKTFVCSRDGVVSHRFTRESHSMIGAMLRANRNDDFSSPTPIVWTCIGVLTLALWLVLLTLKVCGVIDLSQSRLVIPLLLFLVVGLCVAPCVMEEIDDPDDMHMGLSRLFTWIPGCCFFTLLVPFVVSVTVLLDHGLASFRLSYAFIPLFIAHGIVFLYAVSKCFGSDDYYTSDGLHEQSLTGCFALLA